MAVAARVFFWGRPISGKELKALQAFTESTQYWTRMKQKGEIESFEAVAFDSFGDEINGFLIVRGERDKLLKLESSEEAIRLRQQAALLLTNFRMADASIGDELQSRFQDYAKRVKELA